MKLGLGRKCCTIRTFLEAGERRDRRRSGQERAVGNRTAADLERELAMLSCIRDRIRASEGEDFRIPTTAVDQVLDELNSLERSPWDPV
jgi:hypothetical protein